MHTPLYDLWCSPQEDKTMPQAQAVAPISESSTRYTHNYPVNLRANSALVQAGVMSFISFLNARSNHSAEGATVSPIDYQNWLAENKMVDMEGSLTADNINPHTLKDHVLVSEV